MNAKIIETPHVYTHAPWNPWLATAAGRRVWQWEQQWADESLQDVFGYHAVQLGSAHLDALRNNRISHRWLLHDPDVAALCPNPAALPSASDSSEKVDVPETQHPAAAAHLWAHFDALPFESQSLDLVVLPHTLEQSVDPHTTLREVERVLIPEGRVLIFGFNTHSSWALRHRLQQWPAGWFKRQASYLPPMHQSVGLSRLRDWLRLLNLEVQAAQYGCWSLAGSGERLLNPDFWLNRLGARAWPSLGATYAVLAVKRVHSVRLLEARWHQRRSAAAMPVPTAREIQTRQPPQA